MGFNFSKIESMKPTRLDLRYPDIDGHALFVKLSPTGGSMSKKEMNRYTRHSA